MKTNTLLNRVDTRLAACAAAAAAAGATMAVPNADATIVYSGLVNIDVPNTFDGVYINLVTGATGTTGGSVPGWNWNPYNSGTSMSFFWNTSPNNQGLSLDGTTYGVLPFGTSIGSGNTYIALTAAAAAAGWSAGANAYLGVQILNSVTGQTNYGWVHLMTTGATGFPATIVDYAYDNTANTAITAGAVPEPSTFALLGVMAAGALGVREWRKRKAA